MNEFILLFSRTDQIISLLISLEISLLYFDTRRFLGGLQPLCGIGVTSRIQLQNIPLLRIALNAASLPRPGPFIITSARCIHDPPYFMPE